jgi:transcriptional regulator with XRE-family HTH domain
LRTRVRALVKAEKGSTKAVAARLGVSQRTVERYLAGQRKSPRAALQAALKREVTRSWQPRVRARAARAAAARGITVETRARFGFTSPVGTTDDPRLRRISVDLGPAASQELADAYARGATDQELREIVARGMGEAYFQENGTRAAGLDVELLDIDYFTAEF